MKLHRPIFVTPWVLLAACALPDAGADLRQVRDRARQALGEPVAGGWMLEGEARFHEVEGRFEMRADGRARAWSRVEAGPLVQETGWSDPSVWRREGDGPAIELQLAEREMTLTELAVISGAWADPAGPLEIELIERNEQEILLALRARGGRLESRLTLDASDALPLELVLPGEHGGRRVRFDGWREIESGRVPARLEQVTMDRRTDAWVVAGAALIPAMELNATRPEHPPADTVFETPSGTVEIRRAPSGHLFVRPRLDGRDVGWFLFDTGAGLSLIDPAVADELGWSECGEDLVYGLGPGVSVARLRHGGRLSLGALQVNGLIWTEKQDMRKATRLLGEPVAGVLGWDVLVRSVVELDLSRPALRVHDPSRFSLAHGAWQPLTLHHRVPYVPARFEGDREGLFCLDSGAGGLGVLFHHDAVQRLALLEGREVSADRGSGAGGGFELATGELDWFEVAGRRFAPAPASFSTAPDGEADPYGLGFLGGGFFGDSIWVLDYGVPRIAFVAP